MTGRASQVRAQASRPPCPRYRRGARATHRASSTGCSHFAAVLAPTLGTPGMLSEESADERKVVDDLLGVDVELRSDAGAIEP